ncbi:MAG: transcription elongation factor GreA [Candidatus Taylorbacteria bacterium RIFCSPHIGHO2_02_49_25]|uniref:Transcription elongation factor GreA n=1 Tax=Candidatus Taylorbacteria bacterium RIFCSPHIGHO2_02_49_25 TaxID=1802305 RepID=A0A1G2MHA1_9BACT|nr:MAG: Transcription elongation factor GreA [Parcubacteria group bacterium GW2011_GWF2_50_9]OHA21719.1 MAG: transcription elongation factor GreA [Candidatus Taylorbacteria bacterium RIFCSPHIGHO2_01_FULL_49_60]OHA22372.1 MAG: transcription elongation factor GreA [Candidatus Taylorbacteria bacterium RIFCSPHIGHO2_02_49_25]OHA35852.1 MAG: transcription elongation factor GreA [Candidatus Taylorbacteria bacterium RIFCSPLOWO2_02_50_13]OHA37172.1 MAG: transcription elongation factor GreA [Candidatus T
MSDPREYLTKEKYDELKKELEQLKTEGRKKVAESLEYAKSLGDLSENAEYQEAREMQANIEDRIKKLEAMLQSAVIMKMHHTEMVDIGSTVSILPLGATVKVTYKIVGSEEADLGQRKLSINSPLGRGLLGKKKGENLTVKTPGGAVTYTVAHIE